MRQLARFELGDQAAHGKAGDQRPAIHTSENHIMISWLKELDRVLRGEATRLSALRHGSIEIRLAGLTAAILILGLIYGACMGCFSLMRVGDLRAAAPDDLILSTIPKQLLATTIKVPLLFFLTLIVTFPSLYVFNAIVGSRLSILPVLKLLIASLAVNLAVLASLGPIVAFFSVCTSSYSFTVLLNVVLFTAAGILGLIFLLQTLHRLTVAQSLDDTENGDGSSPEKSVRSLEDLDIENASTLDRIQDHALGRHVKTIFRVWVVIFGLVGAQMSWVLRPFVGDPSVPFSFFRDRESNFFQSVLTDLQNLF
ncbi:MAG: hypothetical protein N2C12_08370 [Planctomycetales bacterium]